MLKPIRAWVANSKRVGMNALRMVDLVLMFFMMV